jgi:hypothetical protein
MLCLNLRDEKKYGGAKYGNEGGVKKYGGAKYGKYGGAKYGKNGKYGGAKNGKNGKYGGAAGVTELDVEDGRDIDNPLDNVTVNV